MISRDLLRKAADEGIINNDQVDSLIAFLDNQHSLKGSPSRETPSGDEPIKFIRSFGDVFISLGIVLLVVGSNLLQLSGPAYLVPVAALILIAEWLVRVRRLTLPGIAILLSVLFFVNQAIAFDHENATTFGLATLSLTCLLFYLRYKMPFSLLPLAAGLVAISIIQIGLDVIAQPLYFVGFGLTVFVAAMWFDSQDTVRLSHLSDSAFWLHLLAAPLIVHGTMAALLLSNQAWLQSIEKEAIIVTLFTGFFLLALLLDRRAILISTQLYMIYALTQILNAQLKNTQSITVYVLMVLGLFVIFFGSYWYKTRRFIFGFLRGTTISHYLPAFDLKDNRD